MSSENPLSLPQPAVASPALENAVRRYFELSQNGKPRDLLPLIHPSDITEMHAQLIKAVEIAEPLGEAEGLLRAVGAQSLDGLKAMVSADVFSSYMENSMIRALRVGPEIEQLLEKMMQSFTINEVTSRPAGRNAAPAAKVRYSYIAELGEHGGSQRVGNEFEMTEEDSQWLVRLRPSMKVFGLRMQNLIGGFLSRAARDKPVSVTQPDTELEKFSITGYRRISDSQVILEPRFSSGRDFSGGLAAVRVLSMWGYIKPDGNWAMRPRFSDARDFDAGLAAVAVESADGSKHWGFIDQAGHTVVAFQYESAKSVSEGLAAVKKDGRWGYIEPTGTLVISHRFTTADDFEGGMAEVEWENNDGEKHSGIIDKAGNEIDGDGDDKN